MDERYFLYLSPSLNICFEEKKLDLLLTFTTLYNFHLEM